MSKANNNKTTALTVRQENILNDIQSEITEIETLFALEKKAGSDINKTAERLADKEDELASLMWKAIGNGLGEHPIVKDWIAVHKALGNRGKLRKPRKGLERGVKRPYTEEQLMLITKVPELYRKLGYCIDRVRRHLINNGVAFGKERVKIKRVERQTFYYRLESLGILDTLKEIDEDREAELDT